MNFIVELAGKPLIEDCKKRHAHLRMRLDAFVRTVEHASWQTPIDLKGSFGNADPVASFYIIDVGGKKGARIIVTIRFIEQKVIVVRIFTDHDEYERWSRKAIADHDRSRERGKRQ